MNATLVTDRYGRNARNLFAQTNEPTVSGALAALETLYYAFNNRDLVVLKAVWLDDRLIQLNNPVGGMVRGIEPICDLYARIFGGPALVQVTFEDIVQYVTADTVIFAGRENGQYTRDGDIMKLTIRTSRIFAYCNLAQAWRQIHHHGSIDDADVLDAYQRAIRGSAAARPHVTVPQGTIR